MADGSPFKRFLKCSRDIHEKRYPGEKVDEELFEAMAAERWEKATDEMKKKFSSVASEKPEKSPTPMVSPFMRFVQAKKAEVLAKNPEMPVILPISL